VTTPYWLADDDYASPATRSVSGQVDAVVVGAGVTGCSCALALAKRGLRVRVHEARQDAGGASGRNGGFALRGGALPYDVARSTLGRDRARALWSLTEEALDQMSALAGDSLRRVGSLRLAADADERGRLESELAALLEDGFDACWLDDLQTPLDRLYRGAILHPADGAMHPARWVRRLAAHAREAGAQIVEGSRVDLDSLDAPAIVVAVDGDAATLLPELATIVRPVRGQVQVTAPLGRRLFDRPHYARDGFDYWQQLEDGRLVVGGCRDVSLETEYTAEEETTPFVQQHLERLVADLVGERPPITHRWAGIWGATPDSLPLAGRVPGRDGVWIAAGYSGHGNVLGFACGRLVARAIAGENPAELALFDAARFAPVPAPNPRA
jgi:glycine/D-amino acid oxidase-like deaminating enzyme